jgi:hypothetical protein
VSRLHTAHARRRQAGAGAAPKRETVPVAEVRELGLRPNEARARDFPPMAEDDEFLPIVHREIIRRRLGSYHTGVSIGSDEGWPDIGVWGAGFALRELKGSTGRIYRHQLVVVQGLQAAGIDAAFWWPEDYYLGVVGELLDRLAGGAERTGALRIEPAPADGRRRAPCGCAIDDEYRIPVHTCATWGPPT